MSGHGGGHEPPRRGQTYGDRMYGDPRQPSAFTAASEYTNPRAHIAKDTVSALYENAAQAMVCPITHCSMSEPVMDKEGHTYEKAAIMQWLQHKSTSPVTRNPLSVDDLTPNRALAFAIESISLASAGSKPAPRRSHLAPPAHALEQVKLTACAVSSESYREIGNDVIVHIKLSPPASPRGHGRPPLDLCCVIDVSGSMNAEATLKDAEGHEEGDGLSILDVVRHGVKTIMQLLEPGDRLAVIKYSSTASIVHRLTFMNDAGKALSKSKLDGLTPMGTTNLWDGLKTGMDVLQRDTEPGRTQYLMLLTDGVPNVEPPRGHIPMLRRHYKKFPELRNIVLGTFGFGYKLNSTLLRQIADEGDGTYSFIPDVGLVGTVFTHATANVLSVTAKNTTVEITMPRDSTPLTQENFVGGSAVRPSASAYTLSVPIGSIMFEQDRDICIRVPRASWKGLTVRAQYTDASSGEVVVASAIEVLALSPGVNTMYQLYRLMAEHALLRAAQSTCAQDEAKLHVEEIIEVIRNSQCLGDPSLAALLDDLTGQGSEAVDNAEWHTRWGRHYLLSLSSAHCTQQCNNFKDPGVQRYGGALFSDLRDEADEQFSQLPPPIPTRDRVNAEHAARVAAARGGQDAAAAAAAAADAQRRAAARGPVSMARYNCAAAPCFAGECTVDTPTGPRAINGLNRGDFVLTPKGASVAVVCVVVSKCRDNTAFFVEFSGGLRITPYHPVRLDGVWQHPQDRHSVFEAPCGEVFNLVLEAQHVVVVNGVECITLGHGFQDDPILRHPYLGTDKVVDDLRKCVSWTTGRVRIDCMTRSGNSKTISGLVESC